MKTLFVDARRDLAVFTLITVVASIPFLVPLAQRQVFSFRDHTDYFQPLRYYTAEHLRALHLPLWNPYSASGEPWLANPQTGVFYPPAWIFVLLPFATAYMLFLLFHLALLGCSAWLLFRRFAHPAAALLGAVALMFSGPTLSMLDVQNNLATMAWMLLVIGAALDLRTEHHRQAVSGKGRGSWRRAAVLLTLSFLAGEPFFALLGACAFALIVRRVREVALAGGAAAALSAAQLFPLLEMLAISDRRAGLGAEQVLRDSMPLRDWLRLAVPPRFSAGAFDAHLSQHYVPVIYVGVVVAALAVVGVIALIRARRFALLAAAGATILFVASVAVGPAILAELPVTLFRYPARVVPLAAVAIVALAVAGWDRLRRTRWMDVLVVSVVAAELLAASAPLLDSVPYRMSRPALRSIGRTAKILRLADDPRRMGVDREAWLAGYLNLYDQRFDAWTAAPLAIARYAEKYEWTLANPQRAIEMSVGWVLAARPIRYPRFAPVARVGHVLIYGDPQPFPMAYLQTSTGVIPAKFLAFGPSHLRINISAPEDGVVVVTQNDARGWRVTVDGKHSEKQIANGVFRAVRVPRGEHDIQWSYRPSSLMAGVAVSLLTGIGMVASSFRSRRALTPAA